MTSDTLPPAGDSFSMCIIIVAEYHSVIFLFDYHYSAKKWSIVIDIHDVDDDDDGMKVEDDVGIDNICNVICSITLLSSQHISCQMPSIISNIANLRFTPDKLTLALTWHATMDLKKHETNNHH